MTVTEDVKDVNWVEPFDLNEAKTMLDDVTQEVLNIQDQLGGSKKYDHGRFDSEDEWDGWRQRAKVALRYRVMEQRRLKNWIREHSQASYDQGGSALQDLLHEVVERLDTIIVLLGES